MSNTSATGGYLVPSVTQPIPGGLTLIQFIQTVLVGVSDFTATMGNPNKPKLVRPQWQVAPPSQPDIAVDWIAFGITRNVADANAYVGLNSSDVDGLQRQETLSVLTHFYGPNSYDIAGLTRDGFQIQQNLEALRAANMGFQSTDEILHAPDLVNGRWIERYTMNIILKRQVQRTYPVLPILSAAGTIHTVLGDEEYLLAFAVPEEET